MTIIGGEKPINTAQEVNPDWKSFIIGFKSEGVLVERILTNERAVDFDELVTTFVSVLRGAGLDVSLNVNADGDFVLEDSSVLFDEDVATFSSEVYEEQMEIPLED